MTGVRIAAVSIDGERQHTRPEFQLLVVLPDQNAGGGVRIPRGNYPGVGIWRAASHLTDRNDELFDIGLRLGSEPEQREQDETKTQDFVTVEHGYSPIPW